MILNPGTVIASRYEILEKLGSGGMAIVYKAKDIKLDRMVTFKVMREEFANDEEFIGRFSVEAQAAASLSHQNIVNVYDVGQDDSIHYIVMEYIEGVTLKDLILRRKAFDNDEALGVAIQIASALEHAHNNNIVHRDIKPQNILVTRSGAVKVTDFGIARATSGSTLKADGTTMGSVHYFSPEQARGGYIDAKSDIYSLGITMFEMVTGQVPFDGESPIAVALSQINDTIPDIATLNPNVSASVINIIRKATEKLSGKRYQSVRDMSIDMKHALTDSTGSFVTEEGEETATARTIALTEEDVQYINSMSKTPMEAEEDDYEEEGFTDEDKKAERKIVIAAILSAAAIIIVVVSLGMNYFLKSREQAAKPINPPDLIGRTLEEAGQVAFHLSVNIAQVDTKPSEEYAEGQIMSQTIASEDGQLYVGGTINVIVSRGTNRLPVPDLVNKDLDQVYGILQDTQFIPIERVHVSSETVAHNVVISQEPEAGEMVNPNSEIYLTISKGPELQKATVPDLSGMTDAEAIKELREAKLQAGHSTTMDSETVPEGKIISQTVEAGVEVSINTPVAYVISSGPPSQEENPEEEAEPEAGEQEAEGEDEGSQQTETTKSLTISPQIPDGKESAHVKVLKVTANTEVVFDGTLTAEELPKTLEVKGSGMVEFQVYIVNDAGNDTYQTSEFVDFSQEG